MQEKKIAARKGRQASRHISKNLDASAWRLKVSKYRKRIKKGIVKAIAKRRGERHSNCKKEGVCLLGVAGIYRRDNCWHVSFSRCRSLTSIDTAVTRVTCIYIIWFISLNEWVQPSESVHFAYCNDINVF